MYIQKDPLATGDSPDEYAFEDSDEKQLNNMRENLIEALICAGELPYGVPDSLKDSFVESTMNDAGAHCSLMLKSRGDHLSLFLHLDDLLVFFQKEARILASTEYVDDFLQEYLINQFKDGNYE